MSRTWRARDARFRDNPLSRAAIAVLTQDCRCMHGRLAHAVDGGCDHCDCAAFTAEDPT